MTDEPELTQEHARDKAALEKAQQILLQELRAEMEDRPAHREYLDAVMAVDIDAMHDVPLPKGVSSRVADAIDIDVEWIKSPYVPGYFRSPPERAYSQRRLTDRRASGARERTKHSLGSLLRIDASEESS